VRPVCGCPGSEALLTPARARAQKAERQLKARLEESAKQTSEQLHEAERRLKAQLRSGAVATSTQLARRVERLQRLESSLRAGPVVDRALARHLSSLATAQAPRPAPPGMRKVRSENDFQALQRGGGGGRGSSGGEAQPGSPFAPRGRGRPRLRGHDWDVFAALNGALLRGGRVPADGPARPPSAGLARAASAGLARAPSAAPLAPSRAAPSLQDQARACPLPRPPALAPAAPVRMSLGRRMRKRCKQGAACRHTKQRDGHKQIEISLRAEQAAWQSFDAWRRGRRAEAVCARAAARRAGRRGGARAVGGAAAHAADLPAHAGELQRESADAGAAAAAERGGVAVCRGRRVAPGRRRSRRAHPAAGRGEAARAAGLAQHRIRGVPGGGGVAGLPLAAGAARARRGGAAGTRMR